MSNSNLTLTSVSEILRLLKHDIEGVEIETKRHHENHNSGGLTSFRYHVIKKFDSENKLVFYIDIQLDLKLLWAAYQSLPGTKSYSKDFSENETIAETVIERKTLQVMENLKVFNGTADDYNALAQLIEDTRGAALGRSFGI